jgi:cell division protein FtsB
MMNLPTWSGPRKAPAAATRVVPRVGPRLALALYAGIAIYCSLSILIGPAGLSAYALLEARKADMQANLVELEAIRGSLGAQLEALKSDPDRIALEARGLGYLRKGETAVVLGERVERVDSLDTGTVLTYGPSTALDDAAIKQIAFGVFLAVVALLFAPRAPVPKGRLGARGKA